MKKMMKPVSLILAFMLVMSMLTVVGASAAETNEISVTSNVTDSLLTETYEEYNDQVTVTFSLNTSYPIVNTQACIEYDSDVLAIASGNTASKCAPNLTNCVMNKNIAGEIYFNATTTDPISFSGSKELFTVTFDIIGTGNANVNLDITVLTGTTAGEDEEATSDKDVPLVLYDAVNYESFNLERSISLEGEPPEPPTPDTVTLKLAAPTARAAYKSWTSAVFYYGTASKIDDDKITKLTMTDTGEKYYTQDTFNSEVVTGGAWTVYSVTLTPEQAQAAVSGKFAGFATADCKNRTTFVSTDNVLKAGVDSFTEYSSTVGDIYALDGMTFIFANSRYGATDIVSYQGYWMSDFVTIKTAAPMAEYSHYRWTDVSFYYGTGRWADMNTIQMVNTKENTKVTGFSDDFNLKAGRWNIFAVSVPATVAAEIDAAGSAGFSKTGTGEYNENQNRTKNTAAYNVFKAKVNEFSATYNTDKGNVADFEDKLFVIAGSTSTNRQSVANYVGVWETEDVYTAGNNDTITIYFAAPIGNISKKGKTASWDTGVDLYYSNESNWRTVNTIEMTPVNAVKNVVIDNEDIADDVVSGDWNVYAVELTAAQIKTIDENGRVGFIKHGSWDRTSISMTKDIARAGAIDDPVYGSKKTIEDKDGMIFVITGAYDASSPRTSYIGAWDFFTSAN